jgi:hypothetical protein
MNASAPTYDLTEVAQFVTLWMTVTGVNHITLVSIQPDAGTDTRTFQRRDDYAMSAWIADAQRGGRNVYFQPNETFPECASKPAKAAMMAGLSRFADIDPAEGFPLAEESATGCHASPIIWTLTQSTSRPSSSILATAPK